MSTKEYLQSYGKAKARADRYRERIAKIENTLKGVNLDGMPHSTDLSDPTQIAALNLCILREELQYAVIDAEKICQEIAEDIEKVSNPQFCELLYLRYIELYSWKDTAERLRTRRPGSEYDIEYVKGDMHKRALNAFAKIMAEGGQNG